MTDAKNAALIDRFDALLLDLDGVVYVGPHAVPFAADVIAQSRSRGVACAYVTNNAARPAAAVAQHLVELGIAADTADVVTSPQAATSVLASFVPHGSRVLVVGGAGISQALSDRGYVPVHHLDEDPAAVMQGYSPDLTWRDLAEATYAVRTGIPWIATNPDLTFPTPRGVAPGNGAFVQVVAQTVGRLPDAVAGKPEPPLLREAIARTGASRPLMIGDRLDTDIAAGSRVQMPTLLVFTGVTTFAELLTAIPEERPDYLGFDLRTLLEPYPDVESTELIATCGRWSAQVDGQRLDIVGPGGGLWDAVRAAARLAWTCADRGIAVDHGPVLAQLTALAGAEPDAGRYGGLGT